MLRNTISQSATMVLNLCVQLEVENWKRHIAICLLRVYWIMSSQRYSNYQVALKHPYCVCKCELIDITAKHCQDNERQPLKPNTCVFFWGRWSLSTLDQCAFQKVKAIRFCQKVSAPSSSLAANKLPSPDCKWRKDNDGHRAVLHFALVYSFTVEVHQLPDVFCSPLVIQYTHNRLLSDNWTTVTHHLQVDTNSHITAFKNKASPQILWCMFRLYFF